MISLKLFWRNYCPVGVTSFENEILMFRIFSGYKNNLINNLGEYI